MRLIFIGPPGSGKGTQTKLLSQRLDLYAIGMGDILRQAVIDDSPAGKLAKSFVANGQLVPDDVVNQIISELFSRPERPENFVMDGYPRTLVQALTFDKVLEQQRLPLHAVLVLVVPDEEIVRRVGGRWNCVNPICKATYNQFSRPPKKAGVCDDCGGPLSQRDDDNPDTVAARLRVFHDMYGPLLNHYRKKKLVVEVPGEGDIETIYQNIIKALGLKRSKKA